MGPDQTDIADKGRIRSWTKARPALLRTGLLVLFTGMLAWGLVPTSSAERPGNVLRFVDSSYNDSSVLGLTVNRGRHVDNAAKLQRRWLQLTPTWFDAVVFSARFGEGQAVAQTMGVAAARALVEADPEVPHAVFPGRISGESSGLAWALATLTLSDPALRQMGTVAATGVLDEAGSVFAVGGLDQKLRTPELAGVSALLVPYAQLADKELLRLLHTAEHNGDMLPIVGVRTVAEAVGVLCVLDGSSQLCAPYRSNGASSGESVTSVTLGGANLLYCYDLMRHEQWEAVAECKPLLTRSGMSVTLTSIRKS